MNESEPTKDQEITWDTYEIEVVFKYLGLKTVEREVNNEGI